LSVQLPTEAQWEFACRAGSIGEFAGNLNEMAWYNTGDIHQVGKKKPNAWGLYDMHGNVWEWCQDRFGDYTNEIATDPTGPSFGSKRVNRGGSWYSNANGCRSANRDSDKPENRCNRLGFRCVVQ
jgi:formylglycine-generating enzyme required for sulfatase activity